jgi:hypothetical protein
MPDKLILLIENILSTAKMNDHILGMWLRKNKAKPFNSKPVPGL